MKLELGKDHNTKPSLCVKCGMLLDAATSTDTRLKRGPRPGDASVCLGCGHVMIFGDDLLPREPDAKEAAELAHHRKLLAFRVVHELARRTPEWRREELLRSAAIRPS